MTAIIIYPAVLTLLCLACVLFYGMKYLREDSSAVRLVFSVLALMYSVTWLVQTYGYCDRLKYRYNTVTPSNNTEIRINRQRIYSSGTRTNTFPSEVEIKTFPFVPYGDKTQNTYSGLTFTGSMKLEVFSAMPFSKPAEAMSGTINRNGKVSGTFTVVRIIDNNPLDSYTGVMILEGKPLELEVSFMH